MRRGVGSFPRKTSQSQRLRAGTSDAACGRGHHDVAWPVKRWMEVFQVDPPSRD